MTGEDSMPSGKPLVYGNHWPIVLLNLFLAQSEVRNERDVEVLFYHLPFSQAPVQYSIKITPSQTSAWS
jgi:hypothetical protein